MPAHIYFDLDGTLTDPYDGITRCILYALDKLGFPHPDDDYLYRCIGPPLWDTFPELVGDELTRKAVDLYRERFVDVGWKENVLYDGIHDALETIASAGHTLFVATAKPHMHAARITPQGTLLMFDNGKYRSLPYQPKMPPEESFSRAVEFAIDEELLEFREIWSYGGRPGEIFFTPFLGETDWLPEKAHVLVTDGGRVRQPNGLPGVHPAHGQKWARVAEVTHENPPSVVFEVVIDDPRWGWTVYRSERLPSLYPR